MRYKLFAFDLDGTLLNDEKELTEASSRALHEMDAAGAVVVFATGRLGSSVKKYIPGTLDNVALLTLNGADVCMGRRHGSRRVQYSPLPAWAADYLVDHSRGRPVVCNYYADGRLFAVRSELTAEWIDLYYRQTGTAYEFLPSLDGLKGREPSKIIFVGSPQFLDEQEEYFRKLWGETIYICRTWDYYLEFLNPNATKASGIEALASAHGLDWGDVAAFGDAENDIPMLRKAALGVAMANATPEVKAAAGRVSPWTNDEDGVAREWELIKSEGSGDRR